MKVVLCLCGFTLALITVAEAQANRKWSPHGYPNPRIDIEQCGRRNRKSYICDPDGLLDYEEANQLDRLITETIDKTPCPCKKNTCGSNKRGNTIAIGLVSAMNYTKQSSDNEAMDIEERTDAASKFSYELFRTWNLGKCDEDVVIFFSLRDNALFTFAGREAGKKLHPSLIGSITMDRRGLFGQRDKLYKGLEAMIIDYRHVFLGNYKRKTTFQPQAKAIRGSTSNHITSGMSQVTAGIMLCLVLSRL